jgi:hypothetical protein
MNIQSELKSHFFKVDKWQFSKCLAPGLDCAEPAIRAHSIQNSKVLDLICRDGHVTALTKKIDAESGPEVVFSEVGRNKASTFAGLCSKHDAEIFRPIDTETFDQSNPEHLFLIAYRSVLKEAHATLDSAGKIQSAYKKRVQLGLDSANEPSEAGMAGVLHMMQAHKTHVYQTTYDIALIQRNFSQISHHIFDIHHDTPAIAVSSLFSPDGVRKNGDWINISLNVFPISKNQSTVIFSYLQSDEREAHRALRQILKNKGTRRNYELSKIILNNCENFVISPHHFDSWPSDKREVIKNYFYTTIIRGNLAFTDPRLMLF